MKLPRGVDWRNLALWALGLTLAVLCLGWLMRQESTRQLQDSAEAAGLRWAHFAAGTVPDLDRAFAGHGLTPAAREQLLRLRKAAGVFRFKLFDPAGELILVSDELDKPDIVRVRSPNDGIGAHGGGGTKAHIRIKVLSGVNHVEIKREQRADRPAVYSEA